MDSVSVDGAELTIDGESVAFEYEIGDVIELDEVVVVRLKVPVGEVHNRNVIAVDETATIRWTIPECPRGAATEKPYYRIYMSDGELRADTQLGHDFRVNPETGELSDHRVFR